MDSLTAEQRQQVLMQAQAEANQKIMQDVSDHLCVFVCVFVFSISSLLLIV